MAEPTNAMQNTERHNANVMMASLHFVGYSKSSSSLLLALELRFSLTCASLSVLLSCMEAAAEGKPLSPTPGSFFSRSPTLRAAVFSESVMLTGRSVWMFVSLIWSEGVGDARACARVKVQIRLLKWVEERIGSLREGETICRTEKERMIQKRGVNKTMDRTYQKLRFLVQLGTPRVRVSLRLQSGCAT